MNIEKAKLVAAALSDAATELTDSPADSVAALTMATAVIVATTSRDADYKEQLKGVISHLFADWLDQMWNDPLCVATRNELQARQERQR